MGWGIGLNPFYQILHELSLVLTWLHAALHCSLDNVYLGTDGPLGSNSQDGLFYLHRSKCN